MSNEKDWVRYFSKLEKDNERLKRALKRAHGKIEELENRIRNSPSKTKRRNSKSKSPLVPNPIRNLSIIHSRVKTNSQKKQNGNHHHEKSNKSPQTKQEIGPPPPPPHSKKHQHGSGKLDRKLLALNINLNGLKPGSRKKKIEPVKGELEKSINQRPKIEQALIKTGNRRKRTRKRLSSIDLKSPIQKPLFLKANKDPKEQNEEEKEESVHSAN